MPDAEVHQVFVLPLFDWLMARAGPDGKVEAISWGQAADALGVSKTTILRAIRVLVERKIVRVTRAPTRHRPGALTLTKHELTATDMRLSRIPYRPLSRTDQKRVSQRLLARLVMFHGDHPPDVAAAAAVARIKRCIHAGRAA